MTSPRARLLVAVAVLGIAACRDDPTDETPTGALRLFLDAMARSAHDEQALADAYALLARPSREALDARARRATELAGRDFTPWQMLPQGRFRLRFEPRRAGGMTERIDGERAVVTVLGARSQRADVDLVLEDGRWRVALGVPEMEAR